MPRINIVEMSYVSTNRYKWRYLMPRVFLAFIATLTLTLTTAHAADFQKGLDAFDSGDYATALKEWKPLAEQGNVYVL
jgi:hypothetical protein